MFKTTQTDPYETEFGGTTKERIQPKMSVRTVVLLGLLTALTIVCERIFTWDTAITRISLAFLPKAIGGALVGPVYEGLVCALSDIIGCLLKGYDINPIITLASVLRGVIYGLLLYKKHTRPRIIIAAFLDHFVAGLIVTTAGLVFKGIMPLTWESFGARLLSCSVGFAIEIVVFIFLNNQIFGTLKKVLNEDRY